MDVSGIPRAGVGGGGYPYWGKIQIALKSLDAMYRNPDD